MAWTFLRKVFDFCCSLELAIFLILALATVLAAGTIIESRHGTFIAQEMIYRSPWTQVLLWLLLINVTAVAASRLPWKRHHIGFLITHLGIIVLLLGSFITQRFGVDGTLPLAIGESSRALKVENNYLNVFKAVSGQSYELLLSEHLPWNILRPLLKPKEWQLKNQEKLSVKNYYARAIRDVAIREEKAGLGVPGMRFGLKGSRATIEELLFLRGPEGATRDLGPAQIKFLREKPKAIVVEKPTLLAVPHGPALSLFVAMPKEPGKLRDLGLIKAGETKALGWMDFSFVLKEYFSSSSPLVSFKPLPEDKTPPMGASPVEAVEVDLDGKTNWLELGTSAQVSEGSALYYIQYVRRSVELGFELTLKDFKVGYYPGTNRAMSYSSVVSVGGEDVLIAMNEPMHRGGYTFYQSSFESDDDGKPVLSVLSVNKDPGRALKYAGSLMIVFGILSMFYFKPMYSGKSKWLTARKNEATT